MRTAYRAKGQTKQNKAPKRSGRDQLSKVLTGIEGSVPIWTHIISLAIVFIVFISAVHVGISVQISVLGQGSGIFTGVFVAAAEYFISKPRAPFLVGFLVRLRHPHLGFAPVDVASDHSAHLRPTTWYPA